MNSDIRRHLRVIAVLGITLMAIMGPAYAKIGNTCSTPSIAFSLAENGGKHDLTITIDNQTTATINIFEFYFGENMLRFSAERTPGGEKLNQSVPLLGPGIKNVAIPPKEKLSRSIRLDEVFPDLRYVLSTTDVAISWEFQMKPEKACFSETVSGSMIIKGVRETKLDREG